MIDTLVQGRLVKPAQTRTAANGKPYALVQLAVATGEGESTLVSVIAFRAEAVAVLATLDKGDAVAVVGRASVRTWAGADGALKAGLSVVADSVLTPYHVRRKREAVQGAADAPDRPQSAERPRGGTYPRRARPTAPSSRQGDDGFDVPDDF